jgi:hypothetical protein
LALDKPKLKPNEAANEANADFLSGQVVCTSRADLFGNSFWVIPKPSSHNISLGRASHPRTLTLQILALGQAKTQANEAANEAKNQNSVRPDHLHETS